MIVYYFKRFLLVLATVFLRSHRGVMSQSACPSSYNLAELIEDGDRAGISYNGIASNDLAGYEVSSGGDFNGDGIDDLIIGTGLLEDQVYVVFGNSATKSQQSSFDLENLDGSNGFVINVGSVTPTIASGCDVNHDGVDDLIIGAPNANKFEGAGHVYVLFGSRSTTIWPRSFNVADLNDNDNGGLDGYAIDGFIDNDEVGNLVSCAGDVNGDGIDDFVFASEGLFPTTGDDDDDFSGPPAPSMEGRKGRVYVIWGSKDPVSLRFDLNNLDGTRGFVILDNEHITFEHRYVVSSGGDVNDDGLNDIVIGDFGKVYVVFGSRTTFTSPFDLAGLDGINGFSMDGFSTQHMSLTSDGDVNGDDICDIVIGNPDATNGMGDIFVVFGSSGAWPSTFLVSALNGANGFVLRGIGGGDAARYSVASGGDVDGDGIKDLVIGAPFAGINKGKVFVVFGSPIGTSASSLSLSDLNGNNGYTLNGIKDNDLAGEAVSSGGDLDGDGISDIVIGARGASPNGRYSGQVHVIYGVAKILPGALAISGNTSGVVGDTRSKVECSSFASPLILPDYLACLESFGYYSPPFWFNRNVGPNSAFQFVDFPSAVNCGGSFCGSFIGSSPQETFEYFDFDNLFNQNSKINYIKYRYFIKNCTRNVVSPTKCAKKLSLNVYLRHSRESTAFYDCRYTFDIPDYNDDDNLLGKWKVVRVYSNTRDRITIGSDSSRTRCPRNLRLAFNAGYVLGTYSNDTDVVSVKPSNLIFGFDVMGGSPSDSETLEVCFDDVRVRTDDGDEVVYDLEA